MLIKTNSSFASVKKNGYVTYKKTSTGKRTRIPAWLSAILVKQQYMHLNLYITTHY